MEQEFTIGQMEEDMKVTTLTTKNTDLVFILTPMVDATKDNGHKASNTVKAFL
jgi:hypothetical protein